MRPAHAFSKHRADFNGVNHTVAPTGETTHHLRSREVTAAYSYSKYKASALPRARPTPSASACQCISLATSATSLDHCTLTCECPSRVLFRSPVSAHVASSSQPGLSRPTMSMPECPASG
eukprot:970862-Prymnesium_polylepis.1